MKIVLERHLYAPELNKAYVGPERVCIPAPSCKTIAQVRKDLFAPLKYTGRFVTLQALNVAEHSSCDTVRGGFCNDIRSLKGAIRAFKIRHNLPGCRHIVNTRLIG